MDAGPTIDEIRIADEPARWRDLGFAVEDGDLAIGGVRLRLEGEGAGRGMLGWSLRGIASTELDGLPTSISERPASSAERPEHPNGVTAIDHVVAFSPDLDRTVAALQAAGLPLRRIREEPTPAGAPRQAFFRLGPDILEVIQHPNPKHTERPARLWGLAFVVGDIDAAAEFLGDRGAGVRDAVQEGRRILPLSRAAGLAVPLALMTPR